MPVTVALRQLVQWIITNFGDEILQLTKDALQREWKRRFQKRPFLVFGPSESGKSSLALFLEQGQPYKMRDGKKIGPDPTLAPVLVGHTKKFDTASIKLQADVPGDEKLRDCWAQVLAETKPRGIIYMIDGRKSEEQLFLDLEPIRTHILPPHQGGQLDLKALHVFVSFSDLWSKTHEPTWGLKITQKVTECLVQILSDLNLEKLRIKVSLVHLNPEADAWDDVTAALEQFASDLRD